MRDVTDIFYSKSSAVFGSASEAYQMTKALNHLMPSNILAY